MKGRQREKFRGRERQEESDRWGQKRRQRGDRGEEM
jgi:hypothetical protein